MTGRPGSSVADVVRNIVAEEAPGELLVADGLARLGDDRAVRRLARQRRRQEPLGFGLGEVVPLVTPVLWIALDEAVRRSDDDMADGLLAWALRLLRRVLRRPAPLRPVGPFTQGQLQFLRKRARELALEYGHERKDAEALAERLVARIVLRQEALGQQRALVIADAAVGSLALDSERGLAGKPTHTSGQGSSVAAGTAPQPQAGERVMAAGDTPRFVLLVVLLLVSSGTMIRSVINGQFGSGDFDGFGCLFASGTCVPHHVPQSLWWFTAWLVLLLLAAGVLFWTQAISKVRSNRVVPLESIDEGGEILRLVSELGAVTDLARAPRVVVDPVSSSTSAAVFGRSRRPILCLHAGLLKLRLTDPGRFRAVLLHEFAHVRNGDVTYAYATVALWRVFLALVVLPYVAWDIALLAVAPGSTDWSSGVPSAAHGLILALSMAALAYLVRSDVLRSREIRADLTAIRWVADPRRWTSPIPAPARGRLGRAVDSFIELWRTCPRWDLHRDALTDPSAMSGVRTLPVFLTGAAAALINSRLWFYPGNYGMGSAWAADATALAAAGLVTGVAGIALWRAATHDARIMRRIPSGVLAGLWLGTGMAAGEWVTDQVALGRWLPSQPGGLLLVVLAGAVFAEWTTQWARLWTRVRHGRTTRLAMTPGLAIACVLLSLWFVWRQNYGTLIATGESAAGWTAFLVTGWFLVIGWAVIMLRAVNAVPRRGLPPLPRVTATRATASIPRSGRQAFRDGFTGLATFTRQPNSAGNRSGRQTTDAHGDDRDSTRGHGGTRGRGNSAQGKVQARFLDGILPTDIGPPDSSGGTDRRGWLSLTQAFTDGAGGIFDIFGGIGRERSRLPAFEDTLAQDARELCHELGMAIPVANGSNGETGQ